MTVYNAGTFIYTTLFATKKELTRNNKNNKNMSQECNSFYAVDVQAG